MSGKGEGSYDRDFIDGIKSIVKAGGLIKDEIVIDIIQRKID